MALLSHEILDYCVCACQKDNVCITESDKNVWFEMYLV